jgi:hypothetical protein
VLFTFLDKIGSLFDRHFLFASFLPTFVLFVALGVTFAGPAGFPTTLDWANHIDPLEKIACTALATVSAVVFAYVTGALHTGFLRFWSGTLSHFLFFPIYAVGEERQTRHFERLRGDSERLSTWEPSQHDLREAVNAAIAEVPAAGWIVPNQDDTARLNALAANARQQIIEAKTPDDVRVLAQNIASQYKRFTVDSLTGVYAVVNRELEIRVKRETQQLRNAKAELDRRFGSVETIRASTLGNLIESYEAYPYRRYGIEGTSFWPALRYVVTDKYLAMIEDSQVFLDFAVSMTTFAAIYAGLALFVGPWLWTVSSLLLLSLASSIVSYVFYWIAVSAADHHGAIHRACVDLFRLDLMYALYRPHPTTLAAERLQWRELSQLAAYGETQLLDFAIRPRQ